MKMQNRISIARFLDDRKIERETAMTYDLLIRGGTVIDGSGNAPFEADVSINGSRITAVGKVEGRAKTEVDARGKIVTPGFVDIHTHYDGQVVWSSSLSPSSHHGVTTIVIGNCGVGFAPAGRRIGIA
jgi:N-acyl-D-amino-acid deacylase